MIRVLHLTNDLSAVGGTARKLTCLVRHSDANRFQHCFVAMRGGEFAEELEKTGARVIALESNSPRRILKAAWSMTREWQPDVIATHFTRSFACGTIVARCFGLPVIHHEHGPATLDKSQRSFVKRLGRHLRRSWLPKASAVICNSQYTADALHQMYPLDTDKIKVIHNPVERRSHGDALPTIFATGAIRIGHVGGLVSWRDHISLIRAVSVLKDQGKQVELYIVGDGPMRGALMTEVERLGLVESVTLFSFQRDLTQFYSSIDVYVNPALSEGFGIAVVEAMLETKPVVLANAGAHPELIQDGISGVLYQAGDAADLADKILMLANAPSLAMAIADAGYRHAKSMFASHRFATAYQSIVEEVISGRQFPSRGAGRREKIVHYG